MDFTRTGNSRRERKQKSDDAREREQLCKSICAQTGKCCDLLACIAGRCRPDCLPCLTKREQEIKV